MTGIEPAFQAWEACVLPLNYIRTWDYLHYSKNTLPLQSPQHETIYSENKKRAIYRRLPRTGAFTVHIDYLK